MPFAPLLPGTTKTKQILAERGVDLAAVVALTYVIDEAHDERDKKRSAKSREEKKEKKKLTW